MPRSRSSPSPADRRKPQASPHIPKSPVPGSEGPRSLSRWTARPVWRREMPPRRSPPPGPCCGYTASAPRTFCAGPGAPLSPPPAPDRRTGRNTGSKIPAPSPLSASCSSPRSPFPAISSYAHRTAPHRKKSGARTCGSAGPWRFPRWTARRAGRRRSPQPFRIPGAGARAAPAAPPARRNTSSSPIWPVC